MPKAATAFPRGNVTVYDSALGWRFENPALARLFPLEPMGDTAENVATMLGISRQEQDRFALTSQLRASAATDALAEEILPVTVPGDRGEPTTVARDEGPRADSTIEKLARLRPVFREGGTVTAGNSSQLSDGAAALVLASEEAAARLGVKPLARVLASAAAGVPPGTMGLGPVPATTRVLHRAGLSWRDVDLVELNEAFAAQALGVLRGWEMPADVAAAKVNVHGGAIALGHPLGCSGARLVTALVHELRRRRARIGLATLCVGVGQGVSTLISAEI
jgi:acetyl-CoA acetyltransferase family protein